MPPRLEDLADVYRLGDRSRGFLQVLLPEIVLTRKFGGLTLDVDIRDDLFCIKENAGKRAVRDAVDAQVGKGKQKVESNLRRFLRDEDMLAYRLDATAAPFRYANAGVLPIVRLDGVAYLCLFYRDIFPRGWNIANGASDNERELLDPEGILLREFTEELFIADKSTKQLYRFDPDSIPDATRAFEKSRAAWQRQQSGLSLDDYEISSIPLKWIEGPDRVRVRMRGERRVTTGCFVSVTPEDSGVELDRIAMINLRGDISLFDGELRQGKPINRVVGLFALEGIRKRLGRREFRPDRIFFSGLERDPADLEQIIAKEYLTGPALRGDADRSDRYEQETGPPFDLCPITRSIIRRFLQWEKDEAQTKKPTTTKASARTRARSGNPEVFISYKSRDAEIGRWLHEALGDLKITAFFSEASLPQLGYSEYARAIDQALEHATCMIVIGTDARYFDSEWVGYEWRSFMNEIRSGRKANGRIFTFSHGVAIGEMPYALRSFQNIPYSPSSPRDSLAGICQYVAAALGRSE